LEGKRITSEFIDSVDNEVKKNIAFTQHLAKTHSTKFQPMDAEALADG